MPDSFSALSSDFPTPSSEEWVALVDKTLKGKPFEKAMRKVTLDGIAIDALGTSEAVQVQRQPTRSHGDWLITSPHWGNDPAQINADILEDLERGASAIAISVDASGGRGLAPRDLGPALEGVYLEMVPITLIQGAGALSVVDEFESVLRGRDYQTDSITGCLGLDPIGWLARSGYLETGAEKSIINSAEIAIKWSAWQPGVATFTADGTVFSNAGATESVELAATMSTAVTYLRAMEAAGLSIEVAARQIQFTFSAGSDLWLTMAKYRAARRLWRQVLQDCGVSDIPMKLNAVAAVHSITVKDPWVNILRGTAACFAAATGGADIITTLPHDLMLGSTDKFSRRIARNIQVVLMEESSLAKVTDPAAGSFALEKITSDVSTAAAKAFAAIETAGGTLTEIRSGAIAERIADTAKSKLKDVRTRKTQITGVSEFPDIHEKKPVLALDHEDTPEDMEAAHTPNTNGEVVTALPLRRLAQDFENLRFKSDAIAQKTGALPKAILVNLGVPADFTARATFAKNFFESGGIETVPGNGISDGASAARQIQEPANSVAIICGTDSQYLDIGAEIARALKITGIKRLYLSGKVDDGLAKAGVDEFIHIGCDVVGAVQRAYDALYAGRPGDEI